MAATLYRVLLAIPCLVYDIDFGGKQKRPGNVTYCDIR